MDLHRHPLLRRGRAGAVAAVVAATTVVATLGSAPAGAAPAAGVDTGYRYGDYSRGQAMSILPPGENGLVNAVDATAFLTTGARPAGSQDQLAKYSNLIYGAPTLTDGSLGEYFDGESFGVAPGQVVRTEKPGPGVTILRDTHDVPHVYGDTDAAMAFGAGYAQAEDRLFLMDVLRHYGSGSLAGFLGGSCEFEQMDHDQLLLAPYSRAKAQAQIDRLPAEYGEQGQQAKDVIGEYVDGVNAYIQATRTNPLLLPADYLAAVPSVVPQPWSGADVVSIAGLIGGIFGKGGGDEYRNAQLLTYLQSTLGKTSGATAFAQFKNADDPLAPTTSTKNFPYGTPTKVDPRTTAIPDSTPLADGTTGTAPGCDLTAANPTAMSILAGLQTLPQHMSNALVVDAAHSSTHHPIAVFGPQVSYYAPQILMEIDLHSPTYDAEGASFPGTGLVELGRGRDYAWSATSAGSDLIDQRLEIGCNPTGGAVPAHPTSYLYDGQCLAMTKQNFSEVALPKPGGVGAPAVLSHDVYTTRHGVVQGWTTAGGQPVALVSQRSTFGHEVDSVVGFLAWGKPAETHDVDSWMANAANVQFTFNWLYVDDRDIGYYVSGRDPVRPTNVDPSLPTWGDGRSEWRGFLPASQHVHETNPAKGYFVSWNNKPAPGFAAADDQYGYGQVYRSVLLTAQLTSKLKSGPVTRAQVVQAMETAATQDLDGVTVLPLLLSYLGNRSESPGVAAMITTLRTWIASGAHRQKSNATDTRYASAAAVAISDELIPQLIRALYDPILAAGGLGSVGSTGGAQTAGYSKLPMQWVNTPNSGGAHLGSAYDGGYESYLVSTLQQLNGATPVDGFGPAVTSRECAGGPSTCHTTIDKALLATYQALVTANGGSTSVSTWAASTASAAAKQEMPVYDAIQFRALGIVGQPAIDWQNRPTFQQVVQFPAHRPR